MFLILFLGWSIKKNSQGLTPISFEVSQSDGFIFHERKPQICEYDGCLQPNSNKRLSPSSTLPGLKICHACSIYERRHHLLVPRNESNNIVIILFL